MPTQYKIYKCTNTKCTQRDPIKKPATAVTVICPKCFKPPTYVGDVASTPEEKKSVACLYDGDKEDYQLPKGIAEDKIIQMPSGEIWIRLLQAKQCNPKRSVLLIAHGRQAGPPARTVNKNVSMRSFAYLTPIGHQLVRDFYTINLAKYIAKFQEEPLAWVTADVPESYIGPHRKGELDSIKQALTNSLDLCDIAIVTKLVLNDEAKVAYKADYKVPLHEVIVNNQVFRDYKQFLLMVCRSPWNEEMLETGAWCSGINPVENQVNLYSYDDAFSIGI